MAQQITSPASFLTTYDARVGGEHGRETVSVSADPLSQDNDYQPFFECRRNSLRSIPLSFAEASRKDILFCASLAKET